MMRILLTGGTGFIGQALIPYLLKQGHKLTVLTRQIEKPKPGSGSDIDYVNTLDTIDDDARIDAIVNLAGEPIAGKRWSIKQKDKLIHSRVQTTANIISLIRRLNAKPASLISASAIGYFGAQDQEKLDEDSRPNDEFTHQLCRQWEETALQGNELGVRICIVRLGIVLGKGGGALGQMLPGFRIGLGGRLGSGKQFMSWVAIDDVVSVIGLLIRNADLDGIFNVTAPAPVTNSEFTETLGRVLSRPTFVVLPGPVVKLLFGEMGDRLLLHGQRVIPSRLLEIGFQFSYTELGPALESSIN